MSLTELHDAHIWDWQWHDYAPPLVHGEDQPSTREWDDRPGWHWIGERSGD